MCVLQYLWYSVVASCADFWGQTAGMQVQIPPFIRIVALGKYLSCSLRFSFLICKMVIVIVPTSKWGQKLRLVKYLAQCLEHKYVLHKPMLLLLAK